MDDRACPSCGAQNRATADYCWQCYGSMTAGGSGPGSANAPRAPLAGPLGASAAGTGVATAPLPPPPHVAGSSTDSTVLGWILRGLFVLVGTVGGWFAVQYFLGGFSFPQAVGGQERIETEQAEDAERLVADLMEVFDVKAELALYGESGVPAYSMLALEVPEGVSPAELQAQLGTGAGAAGGPLPEPGSGELLCQLDPAGQGVACAWWKDDVLALGSPGSDPEGLRPVAEDVRADL